MSFLKNIFGGSSENENESAPKMNWNALTDLMKNQWLFSNTALDAVLVEWL